MYYRSIFSMMVGIALFFVFFANVSAQAQPDPPTNVVATQLGYSEGISITWDASATEDVTLYKVYRSTRSSSLGTKLHDVHPTLDYVDDDVSYNTTYYYRVVSLFDGLESVQSDQVSAKPIIPSPVNVQATNTKEGQEIKVTWDRPTYGLVLSFDVYRSTNETSRGSRIARKVKGTEYMDTRATNGQIYYYLIQSISVSDKNSSDSDTAQASASDDSTPDAPTVSTRTSGGNTVRVTWTRPKNITISSYKVYRSKSKSETGAFRIETTGTSFTEHALESGTYYYRVIAISSSGNTSLESEPSIAVIGGAGVSGLLPVSSLKAVATGKSGQIKVTWKNPGKNNYSFLRIYRNTSPGVGSLISNKIKGESFTDTSLTDGVRYYYVVRTVNSNGDEHFDDTSANAVPLISNKKSVEPIGITKLQIRDLSDGKSIKLAWKNPPPHFYEYLTIYRSTVRGEIGEPIRERYRGNEYTNTRGIQTNQKYYYTITTKDFNGVESIENNQVAGIATLKLPNEKFDTDLDGLPDSWERLHGYHPHLKDLIDSDDDNDGLSLIEEYTEGTDPWSEDSDGDGFNDGTEVLNEYNPNGVGKKVILAKVRSTVGKGSFSYKKNRLSSLVQEQDLARELRQKLEQTFGSNKIPNPRKHWPTLVNAYIYGGYSAQEIAHTLKLGPGLVHPGVPAEIWRTTDEYKSKQ